MKKILGLSALAVFLSVASAAALPLVAAACPMYSCPVNGG
jgi:hypothetical protein